MWLVPLIIALLERLKPISRLYDCLQYYVIYGPEKTFPIPEGNFKCDELMYRNTGQGVERLLCVRTTTTTTAGVLLLTTQDEYIPDANFPLPKQLVKGDRKMRKKYISKGESALVGIDTSLELSKLPKGCVQVCNKAGKFLCMGVVVGKYLYTARHKSHALEEFLIVGNNPNQKGKLIHRSKAKYIEQSGGPEWEEERMTCTMWDVMALPLEKDDFSIIGVQSLTRKNFTTKYQGKFCKLHFGAHQVPGTIGAPIYTPVQKGFLPTKIPQAHKDGVMVGRYHSDFGASFAALIVMINGAAKIVGFNLGIPCHELADNEGSFNLAITTEAFFAIITKMGLYEDDTTQKINKVVAALQSELNTARGVVHKVESFDELLIRAELAETMREKELEALESEMPIPVFSKGESKDSTDDDESNSYDQFAEAWKNKRGYEHRKRQKLRDEGHDDDSRDDAPRYDRYDRGADLDDLHDEMIGTWDRSIRGFANEPEEPPSKYRAPTPMPTPTRLPPASKLSNSKKAESIEDAPPPLTIADFQLFEGEATKRFDTMRGELITAYASL